MGPLLRYVDATSATLWVETPRAGVVTVTAGSHSASAHTFSAHQHHFALVELTGLEPGSKTPYSVDLDGQRVWPSDQPDYAGFPPSVIATIEPGKPLRMAFGSCRVSVPHDDEANAQFGVDALRAYALFMAGMGQGGPEDEGRWPDLLLFLGDQVYADETSDAMRQFIKQRRDPEQAPWYELKDFEEYAHLYALAWTDPANRWLLLTLPTAMIFDDHDIRDDWNTSWSWRQQMEATSWWHDRVVGGLASYWIYQHLGNLGPDERADDELWQRVASYDGPGELDLTAELDDLAERADQDPECYRWSYARDFDTQARLVVVDSRAARVLRPDRRSMLDDGERAWLDDQMQGDVDHLLIGTSLPFLMSPALHHIEAFSEAIAEVPGAGSARGWARSSGSLPTSSIGRRSKMASAMWPRWCWRSPRPARPPAADDHVPLRRRPSQLRRRGLAAQRGGHEPDPPGGLLADPKPAAQGHQGLHRCVRPTRDRPGLPGVVAIGTGAARADSLGGHQGPVVPQQPGRPRDRLRRAAHVVDDRRGHRGLA